MTASSINDTVLYELSEGIATITLNRPDKMNAFNEAMFDELNKAIARYRADDAALVCILTAAGDSAFSSGLDIKAAAAAVADVSNKAGSDGFGDDFMESDLDGKPVIMAAFGHCIGQAAALGAWADICICADNTIFSLPEAKIGVNAVKLPGLLVNRIGSSQANYMLLSGIALDAEWALRAGFVHEVVAFCDLMPRARTIAKEMQQQAPLALRAHKRLLGAAQRDTREEVISKGTEYREIALQSADFREGLLAFQEKRRPEFKGH